MATSRISEVLQRLRGLALLGEGAEPPDGELLERFVSRRDTAALEALVRRYAPMVWGVCERLLGNHQDAEDAFQATFLVLVRRAASIKHKELVGNWIYGVAHQTARKARATTAKRHARERQVADMPESQAAQQDLWSDLQPLLDQELSRLPDKYRAAVVLCDLKGITGKEAANQLGVPQGTLASRLTRGRAMLAKRLTQRGLAVSGATLATMLASNVASASVPVSVVSSTIKVTTLVAAGHAASGLASAKVAALTEGVLKVMLIDKLKVLAVMLLSVCLLGSGGVVLLLQSTAEQPASQRPAVQEVAQNARAEHAHNDALGDPLPDGAVSRFGTIRWRHAGRVTFAAFLPDGKTVISAGMDKTIRVWEYPSGKELRCIGPRDLPAFRPQDGSKIGYIDFPIAMSKDGKILAAYFGGDDIVVFDIATGKELRTLKPGAGGKAFRFLESLAFSPDGQHLAMLSADGTASVWDLAKAKELCTLAGPNAPDTKSFMILHGSVVWSPNGKTLATIKGPLGREAIEIWNPVTGAKLHNLAAANKDAHFFGFVFSPDSKVLASVAPGDRISLVDVATAKEIRNWTNASGTRLLSYSPDGTKLYSRLDWQGTVVEWDAETGKLLRNIAVDTSATEMDRLLVVGQSAAWSPDGRVLVLTSGLALSGGVALRGGGRALQFVDVAAGKQIGTGAGSVSTLSAVHFAPDGKHLWVRSSNGRVHKWDAVTGKQLELPTLPNPTLQGPTSPDGKLLVASSSTDPKNGAFVDTGTGKELSPLPILLDRFNRSMLFSPDSKMLAVRHFDEKNIMLYEAPSGRLLHTIAVRAPIPGRLGFPQRAPASIFFSPDSKILAAFAEPNTLAFWNTTSRERMGELVTGKATAVKKLYTEIKVQSGTFSPDGRCVALDFSDGTAGLFELVSSRLRRTYGSKTDPGIGVKKPGPFIPVPAPRVAFALDGQTLIHAGVGADRAIHVWDADSGKELANFKGHTDSVEAIALAADGKTLASASADTTVLLWDLTRVKSSAPVVKALAQADRDACWETLMDADAAKAFPAICDLSASPEGTLALLKERVKPAPPIEMKRIEALVAALQSDEFKTRQDAKAELIKMDERVVPAIDRVLAKKPSLEFKRRLDELRQQLGGIGVLHGERLRMSRAVEVLERIGTPEARQILQVLADGAPGTSLTTSAQATLQRLGRQK